MRSARSPCPRTAAPPFPGRQPAEGGSAGGTRTKETRSGAQAALRDPPGRAAAGHGCLRAPQGDPGHPRATAPSRPAAPARGALPGSRRPGPRPRAAAPGCPAPPRLAMAAAPLPLPAPRSLAAPLHVTEQNPPRHSPLCPTRPGHRERGSPTRGGGQGRLRGRREATRRAGKGRAGEGSSCRGRSTSTTPPPPPRPGHLPRRGRLRPSRGAAPGRRRPPCSRCGRMGQSRPLRHPPLGRPARPGLGGHRSAPARAPRPAGPGASRSPHSLRGRAGAAGARYKKINRNGKLTGSPGCASRRGYVLRAPS